MWKPFVMLLWGGEAMVNLFFVISGYALSYKPLSLLYASQYQKMYEGIASSVFRRAFRLWLPAMAAVLLIAFLTRMHAFEPARHVYSRLNRAQVKAFEASTNVTRLLELGFEAKGLKPLLVREPPPPMANSTFAQGLDAIRECLLLVKASTAGEVKAHDLVYDAHAWTIPVEFKSSITIFILAVGTSKFESKWRLLLHGTVLFYCTLQGYRTSLFVAGMILAEIDLIRKHLERVAKSRVLGPLLGNPLPQGSAPRQSEQFDTRSVAWGLCFVIGLYILSIPFIEPVTASPYVLLAKLLPPCVVEKNKLIRSIGAVMTTWSCVHFGMVTPILNSGIAQYLGRISFALYLTHGLVIRSLGYVVIWKLRAYSGAYVRERTSLGQFVFIWLCGYIVILPVCLWMADLFWRSIDTPSVKLARWLEQQLVRQQERKARDKDTEDTTVGVE
jgi:peptidoglycan/LPS O-acetylase OafA/YrhL